MRTRLELFAQLYNTKITLTSDTRVTQTRARRRTRNGPVAVRHPSCEAERLAHVVEPDRQPYRIEDGEDEPWREAEVTSLVDVGRDGGKIREKDAEAQELRELRFEHTLVRKLQQGARVRILKYSPG